MSYEEREQKPWEYGHGYFGSGPKHPWTENLMTHDYPESGPGRVDIEDLYQSFKERLMHELKLEPK